jgi:hypothetical protein
MYCIFDALMRTLLSLILNICMIMSLPFRSISPWEQGRIAMICAPAFLLGKFTDFFVAVGYPTECIMTVETF